MLGEFLEQNCPDVSVQVVIKSAEDWGEYLDSVSKAKPTLQDLLNGYLLCAKFRCADPMAFTSVLAPSSTLLRVSPLEMVQISLSM